MGVISVQLRNEDCHVTRENPDIGAALTSVLPAYDDLDFPFLRLIDPYGDTVFSGYQMAAVIPELEALAARTPSPALGSLLEMAHECQSSVHMYLAFIGD